jgi:hypothetical protein
VLTACFAAALLLADPVPARADWLLNAYMGMSKTADNTVRIEPTVGDAIRIGPIAYQSQPFKDPIYYGWRIAYFPSGARWLGVGIEFTHNKAIADVNQPVDIDGAPAQLSDVLQRLEMSNGLNFTFANAFLRRPIAIGGTPDRVSLMAYGGLGASIPHVETIFADEQTFEYQIGGLGWQAGGGVEWRLVKGVSAIADYRLTSGKHRLDMGTGTLIGTFTSTQIDFGIALHLGQAR